MLVHLLYELRSIEIRSEELGIQLETRGPIASPVWVRGNGFETPIMMQAVGNLLTFLAWNATHDDVRDAASVLGHLVEPPDASFNPYDPEGKEPRTSMAVAVANLCRPCAEGSRLVFERTPFFHPDAGDLWPCGANKILSRLSPEEAVATAKLATMVNPWGRPSPTYQFEKATELLRQFNLLLSEMPNEELAAATLRQAITAARDAVRRLGPSNPPRRAQEALDRVMAAAKSFPLVRPAIFPCGCSKHKVDLGRCDQYQPGGNTGIPIGGKKVSNRNDAAQVYDEIALSAKQIAVSLREDNGDAAFGRSAWSLVDAALEAAKGLAPELEPQPTRESLKKAAADMRDMEARFQSESQKRERFELLLLDVAASLRALSPGDLPDFAVKWDSMTLEQREKTVRDAAKSLDTRRSPRKFAENRLMTADAWNAAYQVGIRVRYFPVRDDFDHLETVTRSAAWTLGHGVAVVKIAGLAGGVALDHIVVVPDSE